MRSGNNLNVKNEKKKIVNKRYIDFVVVFHARNHSEQSYI